MLYTDLSPLRSFIITDVLPQAQVYEYTSGYIYYSRTHDGGNMPYMTVKCVITRIGKTGKVRIKAKELYVAPLVYKDLIDSDFYEGFTHMVTKMSCKNVMEMDTYDFLAWYYTHISYLHVMRVELFCPGAFDGSVGKLRNIARNVSSYSPDDLDKVLGSAAVREFYVQKLNILYGFLRHRLIEADKVMDISRNLLSKYLISTKKQQHEDTYKVINKHYGLVTLGKNKLEELSTGNKDVLQKYEDSGYWV